jgi:hypothetical protein
VEVIRHAISYQGAATTQTEISNGYSRHEIAFCAIRVSIAEMGGALTGKTDIDWL